MTTKMIRVDAWHEGLVDSFVDENLEYMQIIEDHDAYFYERKEQLTQTMDAIDNGTMKLLSEDEFSSKMKDLESKLTLVH